MKKIKKRYYVLLALFLIVFSLMYFASTIAKNYLVKNSMTLMGRKLEMNELHINYLKVAVEIKGFTLYEADKTSKFVSFSDLYINFDPLNLLSKEFSFSEIRLSDPYLRVTQKDSIFNFSDIIAFFADTASAHKPKPKADTAKSEMRYSVANFDLNGGQILYQDLKVKSKFNLKNLNLKLPYISWDSKNANMGLNFNLGEGSISINSQIFPTTKDYHFQIQTKNLSLEPFAAYMKDFMAFSSFKGFLNTDVALNGNYENTNKLVVSGKVSLKNIIIKDTKGRDFAKTTHTSVYLDSIDLEHSFYKISKIHVEKPYINAELEKKGTNFDQVFAPLFKVDPNAPKVDSTKKQATTPVRYEVDSIVVSGGLVDFKDNSLNRAFFYKLPDLNVRIGKLTESADKIPVDFSVKLNQLGSLQGKTTFSMVDTKNILMDLKISEMDLVSFSPYSEYFVARPITHGKLDYQCSLKMTAKTLNNNNKVLVNKLDFGKKTKDATAMKVPVMLGLYLLKDSKGNIQFDLPVTGNPSNPEFKYKKIIWQTLVNLLVKVALEPFKALGSLLGTDPESMKTIEFGLAQDSLASAQTDKLDKILKMKEKKPELAYMFTQETDIEQEKGLLAKQEVKCNMVAAKFGITDEDGIRAKANQITDKDTAFVKYVNAKFKNTNALPLDEVCRNITGSEKVNLLFSSLLSKRNALISNYLISKGFAPTAVRVVTGDLLNMSKQQRTTKYRVEVQMQ